MLVRSRTKNWSPRFTISACRRDTRSEDCRNGFRSMSIAVSLFGSSTRPITARVPMTSNLTFSAFAIRRAAGLVDAAGAARPLVLTTGFDEVEGVAAT